MTGRYWRATLLIIGLLAVTMLPTASALALEVPPKPTSSPIVDQANVLNPQQKTDLESLLAAETTRSGNQIGILVVKSLEGESLEDYSIKVARAWGIGDRERNNGVLLLAAIDDRKLRIEVGRGLEGSLTDLRSSRIIRDRIAPEFRKSDYYAGLRSGVEGITVAIKDEVDPALNTTSTPKKSSIPWELLIFGPFIALSWLGSILARSKSWWAGGLVGGGIGAVGLIFLGLTIISFGLIAFLVIAGLLFDRAISKNFSQRKADGLAPAWWAGGTHLGGGGSSGSGGFGGFGGGGFGGGGSSGSW